MTEAPILVTGGNGFVGGALCVALSKRGLKALPVVRRHQANESNGCIIKDIQPSTDWRSDLHGIDTVIHTAGRVHVLQDSAIDPLREYRTANVEATVNLALQAADAGVRRFIFLSSVKVNGEFTNTRPFVETDSPAPVDPYGVSKHEAEQALWKLAKETELEVVIIRPPLVYGPHVKANFLQLMRLVRRGLPLPLKRIDNRRSMIFIGNLVDMIVRCIRHTDAPGRTFLVSDGHDVSTAELIRELSLAMGMQPRLFSVPPAMLKLGASMVGKGGEIQRLLDSLQVDINCAKQVLGWMPPYSFHAGIDFTVKHFLESHYSRANGDVEETL